MDSPEDNHIIPFTSSSPASSSAALQISPYFNFLSNFSPIRSVKAVLYCQRFSQTNLSIPFPVFNSPDLDLQQQNSSLLSELLRVAGSDVYRQSDIQLKPQLMLCFRKEVPSHSPSECVDEYLADPVEGDNTMNSSASGFTSRKETTTEADDTNAGNAKAIALMSDQTGGELPSVSMNFFEATTRERETERFREFLQCLSGNGDDDVESDIFGGLFFGAQHQQLSSSQSIELQAAGGQHNKLGASFLLFPESLQRDEAYTDSKESLRSVSKGPVKETDQRHRGIRRHLHFGAAIACKHTGNGTHETDNVCLPARQTDFESWVPPNVEPRGISGSWQARSCAQTATLWSSFCPSECESVRSAQNCGNRAVSACIPSGGGLHLNSVVIPDSMGSDSSISKTLVSTLHQQEEKLMPDRDHYLGNEMDGIPVFSFSGEIYTHLGKEQQERRAAVGAGSSSYQSTGIMQPPCDSLHLIPFEQQATPCEGTMPSSENADIVELNQVSPEIRNRKKAKYTIKSEGCRRCNCKRSRCLKLYCECFAAGIYCLDTCTCENCFNKPEYEDTVLDMRQQIEARNPLAFAPKVVKHATNSPAYLMEEGNWTTPSSSRHKRGCNCKKSKCSKKYCECFQAGVGCCDGCRCEGCYNPYGHKRETIYKSAERWNNPSKEQQDTLENHSDCIKAEKANQFSSTWEELADVGHLTAPSHCLLGAVASSASLNIRDCSKFLLGQSQQESSLLSPSGYHNWGHSPCNLTPKLYGSEAFPELSSDSFFCNILEDDSPETLKNTCSSSIKGVKSCSPNQKRVSPPQIRSNELRSSSSWGLRSGRKFILEDLPSFPSLTPYSKSQAGIYQNDGHHKGSTGYQ